LRTWEIIYYKYIMISDTISIFKAVLSCTQIILCELQSMQSILEITNTCFPIYESALYSLQHSMMNLMKIYNYKIPIQHVLKFELLNLLRMKLDDFSSMLTMFRNWDRKFMNAKCITCDMVLFLIANPKPSNILKKIESAFSEIQPLIKEQISLETTVLGSAISIEHPILQKAWIMLGANQIGETDIPLNLIADNLYSMYLIEENNYVPNKEYITTKITEFLKEIDGIAASKPDGKISITEINFFKPNEHNTKSVKDMCNITRTEYIALNCLNSLSNYITSHQTTEPDILEPINVLIPMDFNKPVTVNCSDIRTIKEPLCVGYGADFNNINACEFIVPCKLLPNDKYKLSGITVECVACDQGFGGTNQCHLRYQINNNVTVKVFQIDRNQFPNNIYKFSIPPENIELDNKVTLWIFSPQWGGWCMTLSSVTATANFVAI